jgi:hypothetical protein
VIGFPEWWRGFDPSLVHVVFMVDKVGLGQVFSEYFGFPCQFSFHEMLHTHLSSGAGTIAQLVANLPNGLNLTLPNEILRKNKNIRILFIRLNMQCSHYYFLPFVYIIRI